MEQVKKSLVLKNKYGMHARPAMQFVELTSKYSSEVIVVKDGKQVDGKSIMGMMTLAAEKGTALEICINGDDAAQLIQELERLIDSKFGEE